MTDSPESRDQIIGYASSLRYIISAAQLARWHRAGLLPRPRQRPLGRGRGTETIYPPGTSVQVVALCQIKAEEHRLDRVAFRLWWEGFAIEPDIIRNLLAAIMNRVDAELSQASLTVTTGTRVESGARWSLGRTGVEAMIAMTSHNASGTTAPVTMSGESVDARPPSLEDMATLTGQALAAITRDSSVADLVAEASDDELIRARDRSRSMLALMQSAAAPMAWLYGKSGSAFRFLDRMIDNLAPSDNAGIVAAMLAFAPLMRPETLAAIDSGTEPPLAHELRQILAIRDQVPGAADVLTPPAIRALLRDKEAASRYRPRITKFFEDHSEEIQSVLARVQPWALALNSASHTIADTNRSS
jgi:hypothetical protein